MTMTTTTSSKSSASKGKGKSKAKSTSLDPDEPSSAAGQAGGRVVRDRRRRRSASRRRSGARDDIEEGAASSLMPRPPLPLLGIAQSAAGSPDYLHLLPYELWLVVFNHVRRIPAHTYAPGHDDDDDDDAQLDAAAAKHLVIQTLWAAHRTCRLFRTITHVFLATAVLDACPYLPLLLDTNVIAKHRAAASLVQHDPHAPTAIPLILLLGPSPDPSSQPADPTDTDPTAVASSSRAHRLAWSKAMARHLRLLSHPHSSSLDSWSPATPTPPYLAKLPTLIAALVATSFAHIPPDKYTSDFTDWHAFPTATPISATPALDSAVYDPNALHMEQLRDLFHREAGRRGKVVSRAWVEYADRKERVARDVARSLVRVGAAFAWRWSARAREALDQVLGVGGAGERAAGRRDEAEAGRMRVRRDRVWADMAAEDEDEWASGRKGKGKASRRASRGSASTAAAARRPETSSSSAAPAASTELGPANDVYAPDHTSAQADFESAYPTLQPEHILDLAAARDLVRAHRDAIDTHPVLPRALLAANLLDSASDADTDVLAARPSYSTASPTYLARLVVAFAAFAPDEYQVLRFPASVAKRAGAMRKRVHRIAEEVGGVASRSFGSGGARFLVVVRVGGEEGEGQDE